MSGGRHLNRCSLTGQIERGILLQDRLLKPLQRRARFQPELLDQHPARRLVGPQRLRLPPAPVQGDHQLLMQPLAQRPHGNQRLELADNIGVTAEREIRLDPIFNYPCPQFLQPGDLGLRERLRPEIGERRPTPQCQRLAKISCGTTRIRHRQRAPASFCQALEPHHINLLLRGRKEVAARPRQHALTARCRFQRLTQPPDIHLYGVFGACRGMGP